ncbi:MAG: M1 family aminopeptidase [Chloroflexota bacterium]
MYTSKHVHKYTRRRALSPISYLPTRIPQIALLATVFFLASCGPDPAPATITPTSLFSLPFVLSTLDPNSPPPTTEAASPTPTLFPTETSAALPPDTSTPITSSPVPLPPTSLARPVYTVYATIDFDNHTVDVDESIVYPNLTGATRSELVIAVEPMLYGNAFHLVSLSVNGLPITNYSLDSHRLAVPIPPLPPNTQVALVIEYELNVPVKQQANTFGWLDYQTNLTEWIPFVVPYDPNSGWILHDFLPWGEHLVYDSADFEVNIRFADPSSVPVVAAPALPEANGEWTRYRLMGARTFALALSRDFKVNESAVGQVAIRTYYFAGHEDAASKMTYVATQAVGLFEPKFAPYPYPVLNIVELDYNDGQENDGLVFLSSAFFDQFSGGVKNNMVVLGVHEISHNWWFGLVGNDQAMEPWLDEAMCLYSERIFFEYTNPDLLDWWWQFRVNYFGPNGWVDLTIYDGISFRDYTNAVYLNGATFIEDLRVRMGDDNFYKFIKDYAAQMSYRRATADDFFRIVRQHTNADISDLIAAYFRNPH